MKDLNQPIVLNINKTPYMQERIKRESKLFDKMCNNFKRHSNESSS